MNIQCGCDRNKQESYMCQFCCPFTPVVFLLVRGLLREYRPESINDSDLDPTGGPKHGWLQPTDEPQVYGSFVRPV